MKKILFVALAVLGLSACNSGPEFKVEGEIADTYGDRVAAGGRAIVKIGNEKLEGTVSSVTPLSKNGVISFIVQLNEDNNKRLR